MPSARNLKESPFPARFQSMAKHRYFYPALLVIATFIVFCQVIGHEFVWYDDDVCVYENPYLQQVTVANIIHFWEQPLENLYTPLTQTVWAIQALFARTTRPESNKIEFNPAVFHATNLIFHVASALLVFLILRILIRDELACFLGALLFAIHPVQVESVAWVASLKDVLSGFFSLVAIWQYLLYAKASMQSQEGNKADRERVHGDETGKRKTLHYLVAVFSFILALFAKPTRVIVPIAAFMLDYFIIRRRFRDIARSLIGWIAVALPMIVVTIVIMRAPDETTFSLSFMDRLLVASDSLVFYLYKLIVPISLGPDYGRTPQYVLSQHLVYVAWIVPAALLGAIYAIKKHRSWLLASAGVFIAGVLPALGFLQFKFQEISTVADRYLYLSMLGPGMALAFFLSRDVFSPNGKRMVLALCGVMLCFLGFLSIKQTGYWKNSVTFFRHAVQVNPDSSAFHANLGIVLAKEGRVDEALSHFSAALKSHSNPAGVHIDMGHALAQQGKFDEAIVHYSEAIKSHPDPGSVYVNIGRVLARQGKFDGAIFNFQEALKISPRDADAHANLGIVLAQQGKADEALSHFSEALKSDPNNVEAHLNAGYILARQGKINEAVSHYYEGLRFSPDNAWAHNNLGIALAQQGKIDEAIFHFNQALKINPGYQDAYKNLIRARSLQK